MQQILLGVGSLILFIAIILGLDYSSLLWESFISPKRENVRREIFEQTKSFKQGMAQELIDIKYQYITAKSEADKATLKSLVRHKFADFDDSKLPLDLRSFLRECRGGF